MKRPTHYWQRQVRLCADCGHTHGGRGYGLCYYSTDGEMCPCIVARPVLTTVACAAPSVSAPRKQRRVRVSDAPCSRTLSRHAARDWRDADPALREKYERIARRWSEQDDLSLWEWAAEYGVRRDFLKRAALSAGIRVVFGNPGEAA